jgi:hypothetical protein
MARIPEGEYALWLQPVLSVFDRIAWYASDCAAYYQHTGRPLPDAYGLAVSRLLRSAVVAGFAAANLNLYLVQQGKSSHGANI